MRSAMRRKTARAEPGGKLAARAAREADSMSTWPESVPRQAARPGFAWRAARRPI